MNPDVFAEWMRRQGQTVYKTDSSYWHTQGPRVLQGFPYHWVIAPPEQELFNVLRDTGSIGLRYSTPVSAPVGQISYHAVLEGKEYDIEMLGKWARKNVRRGLKFCSVEQVSFKYLAIMGWHLQLDTLRRQGRKLDMPRKVWNDRCMGAEDLPGFKAWGAFVGRELAASVITFQMGSCAYMLYQQCLEEYLPEHVNNALSYVVTQAMVSTPGINSILYGLHSLDAPASVDEFKFRMGYVARPVRQRVVFHPLAFPLANPISYSIVKGILDRRPGSPFLAKTEGMLRFYLQGKRPLEDQNWPENLLDQRKQILSMNLPGATKVTSPVLAESQNP